MFLCPVYGSFLSLCEGATLTVFIVNLGKGNGNVVFTQPKFYVHFENFAFHLFSPFNLAIASDSATTTSSSTASSSAQAEGRLGKRFVCAGQ